MTSLRISRQEKKESLIYFPDVPFYCTNRTHTSYYKVMEDHILEVSFNGKSMRYHEVVDRTIRNKSALKELEEGIVIRKDTFEEAARIATDYLQSSIMEETDEPV